MINRRSFLGYLALTPLAFMLPKKIEDRPIIGYKEYCFNDGSSIELPVYLNKDKTWETGNSILKTMTSDEIMNYRNGLKSVSSGYRGQYLSLV